MVILYKGKEPSLPYYLPIAEGGKEWIYAFPKNISMKLNANSFIQALKGCRSISHDNNFYAKYVS